MPFSHANADAQAKRTECAPTEPSGALCARDQAVAARKSWAIGMRGPHSDTRARHKHPWAADVKGTTPLADLLAATGGLRLRSSTSPAIDRPRPLRPPPGLAVDRPAGVWASPVACPYAVHGPSPVMVRPARPPQSDATCLSWPDHRFLPANPPSPHAGGPV